MSRTVLGPLITTFNPPAACTIPAKDSDSPGNVAYLGQGCFGFAFKDTASCWPTVTISSPAAPFLGLGVYSPGFICPNGYETACSSVHSDASVSSTSFQFQYPLTAGETGVGCCPSGYVCGNINTGQTCSRIARSTSVEVGSCDGQASSIDLTAQLSIPFTTGSTIESSLLLLAPMFQMVWQSKDKLALETTSGGTAAKTSSASQSGASQSSAPSSNTPPASSGPSAGVIAGISVGVTLAVILVIGLVAMFIVKHRRRKRRELRAASGAVGRGERDIRPHQMGTLVEKSVEKSVDPKEKDRMLPQELSSQPFTPELRGSHSGAHELDTRYDGTR